MAFFLFARTDIPNGVLQIGDVGFNGSTNSKPTDPVPQGPVYLRQPVIERLYVASVGEQRYTRTPFRGLVAYILDTVSDDIGEPLAPFRAYDIAIAIRQFPLDGSRMRASDILGAIGGELGAPPTFTSPTLVTDVLRLLSGEQYLLPPSTLTGPDGQFDTNVRGSFQGFPSTDAYYDYTSYYRSSRFSLATGNIEASVLNGELSILGSELFTYGGVQGAAVYAYDAQGNRIGALPPA